MTSQDTIHKITVSSIITIVIVLLSLSVFSLSGCSNDSAGNSNNPSEQDQTSEMANEQASKQLPNTPLSDHGALHVEGTQLTDVHGDAFQICGISTHGINWFPEYVNYEAFQTLRDDWNVNCIRLALYTAEYNGYCESGDKNELKSLIKSGVTYAEDLGMYVIVDWHVLQDKTPAQYQDEAIAFFDEISAEFADNPGVIYEICNEPNGDTTWDQVKAYAETVIPVIRSHNPNAVVIVGTPTWSQDIDKAASNPLTGDVGENTMYALHFYADTHRQALRDRMMAALDDGLPIFISEFGTCDASGNGANNFVETEAWLNLADEYGVSYCCWNLSNKDESSSLLAASTTTYSDWSNEELSESGQWIRNRYKQVI